MKTVKISYWVTTTLITLMMIYSAYAYLTQDAMIQAFHHLGYPDYFRVELAIGKVLGALLLITPVSAKIKEWVYAGFVITFISAFVAHTASGDPFNYRLMPVFFLTLLIISYMTYNKQNAFTKINNQITQQ